MNRVNLLPESYLRNIKSQQIKNRIIYALLFVILILYFIYRMLMFTEAGINTQTEQMQIDNSNLQQLMLSLVAYDTAAEVQPTGDPVAQILSDNPDFLPVLVQITDSTPKDIQVTNLHIGRAAEGEIVCFIDASAENNEEISVWIDALAETPRIGAVQPSAIQLELNAAGNKHYRFSLSIQIENP